VIIGDGPEYKKLKARATANVELLGFQDDETLLDHMQRARAFVFGAVEDFGIMPVEAQACGTPVIGVRRGGVAETVIDGETGMLFEEQTPECVAEMIRIFSQLPRGFLDPDHIRANAERFSVERFRREFGELVNSAIQHRRRYTDPVPNSIGPALSISSTPQVGLVHG
jgi:glycosyltransferase involved in cell wall biosynthesis